MQPDSRPVRHLVGFADIFPARVHDEQLDLGWGSHCGTAARVPSTTVLQAGTPARLAAEGKYLGERTAEDRQGQSNHGGMPSLAVESSMALR